MTVAALTSMSFQPRRTSYYVAPPKRMKSELSTKITEHKNFPRVARFFPRTPLRRPPKLVLKNCASPSGPVRRLVRHPLPEPMPKKKGGEPPAQRAACPPLPPLQLHRLPPLLRRKPSTIARSAAHLPRARVRAAAVPTTVLVRVRRGTGGSTGSRARRWRR